MSMIEMITGEKPYSECKGQIVVVFNKVKNKILPECFSKIRNEKVIEFNKCLKPEEERPSADYSFLNDLDIEDNKNCQIKVYFHLEILKAKKNMNFY